MENDLMYDDVPLPCYKSIGCRICFGIGLLAFLGIVGTMVAWVLYAIGTS